MLVMFYMNMKVEFISRPYLNYYDNPFTTYSTSSTEKSGFLTIQFSDNPDKNVLEYK